MACLKGVNGSRDSRSYKSALKEYLVVKACATTTDTEHDAHRSQQLGKTLIQE